MPTRAGRSGSGPGSPAPWRAGPTWSSRPVRRSTACLRWCWPRRSLSLTEAHPIAVAMGRGALVGIAGCARSPELAEDDDAGGAPVDAQGAAGADVVVDGEDHVVARVEAGLLGAHRSGERR